MTRRLQQPLGRISRCARSRFGPRREIVTGERGILRRLRRRRLTSLGPGATARVSHLHHLVLAPRIDVTLRPSASSFAQVVVGGRRRDHHRPSPAERVERMLVHTTELGRRTDVVTLLEPAPPRAGERAPLEHVRSLPASLHHPGVDRVQAGVEPRAESPSPPSALRQVDGRRSPGQPDVAAVADEVLRLIDRRIVAERERRGHL